jgi:hypothetical protein
MPRGSGMPLTRRRRHKPAMTQLPPELSSFDRWYYPGGINDYMRALSQHIGAEHRVTPVMNAAGLSAADWFRAMLGAGASEASAS